MWTILYDYEEVLFVWIGEWILTQGIILKSFIFIFQFPKVHTCKDVKLMLNSEESLQGKEVKHDELLKKKDLVKGLTLIGHMKFKKQSSSEKKFKKKFLEKQGIEEKVLKWINL